MFADLNKWVIILIVVGATLIIGGIVLPLIVPMMIGYTQDSQSTTSGGTAFLQLMIDWWPLIIPVMVIFGLFVFIMSHRNTP